MKGIPILERRRMKKCIERNNQKLLEAGLIAMNFGKAGNDIRHGSKEPRGNGQRNSVELSISKFKCNRFTEAERNCI